MRKNRNHRKRCPINLLNRSWLSIQKVNINDESHEVLSDWSRKIYPLLCASDCEEMGVALRAGLLASLKPRGRVFPLPGCHP